MNNPCVQLFWLEIRTLGRPTAEVLSDVLESTPMYAGTPGPCDTKPAAAACGPER